MITREIRRVAVGQVKRGCESPNKILEAETKLLGFNSISNKLTS